MLAQIGHLLRGDPQELGDHLLTAATFERGMAGEGTEQGGAEAVDIGGRSRRVTAEHLRGGERRRTR